MSQHDMNLADQAGAAFRADLNNALAALVGNSSGATEPATMFAYMFWADTTSGRLKQRNAANSAWLDRGPLAGVYATFGELVKFAAGSDIASAATIDLTAATGNTTRITGTTATSAFTMTAGQWHLCIADGVWPLTYHATTNKLDTGADYTCQAGDRLLLVKDDDNIVHGMIFPALATQAEMEAGTGTGIRLMTPERVAQAIAALASGSSLTIGSFTAWTSGAYKDITGISGAKRITISPKSLSTSGTSNLLIQIGDATGGLKTSGYESGCTNDAATRATSTAGFIVSSTSNAAYVRSGTVVLTLVDSSNNTWAMSGQISETGSGLDANSGGQVTLSGPLDRFRFTTVGGTDTGDAGGFGYSVEV